MQELRVVSPSFRLKKYVDCYWYLQSDRSFDAELCLPDGAPSLILSLQNPYQRKNDGKAFTEKVLPAGIAFQGAKSVRITHEPPISVLAVRFRPYGLYYLCGICMTDLLGFTPLKYVFPGISDEMEEHVFQATSIFEKIRALEKFLSRMLPVKQSVDLPLERAVELIELNNGNISIDKIRQAVFVEKSTLEKKFKEKVGLSPKTYGNIIRFNQALLGICQGKENQRLTDLAYQYGYYDQSHFIRSFKNITGLSPHQFIRSNKQLSFLNRAIFMNARA